MRYTTVLLDLDDTLVVEEQSARQSFLAAAALVRQHHDIAPEEFVSTVRSCARELWYSLPTHGYAMSIGIASHEALWAEFSDNNPRQSELLKYKDYYQKQTWLNALAKYSIMDEELALRLSLLFKEERRKRQVLFDDAKIFLDRLHDMDVRMALVSNGTPDLQREKIRKSGIEPYFDAIVISGEIGFRKPGREIFARCLQRLGGSADQSVMIGDRLDTDIKGANEMNIASVWLNRENKKNDAGIVPGHEIHALFDAIHLIA